MAKDKDQDLIDEGQQDWLEDQAEEESRSLLIKAEDVLKQELTRSEEIKDKGKIREFISRKDVWLAEIAKELEGAVAKSKEEIIASFNLRFPELIGSLEENFESVEEFAKQVEAEVDQKVEATESWEPDLHREAETLGSEAKKDIAEVLIGVNQAFDQIEQLPEIKEENLKELTQNIKYLLDQQLNNLQASGEDAKEIELFSGAINSWIDRVKEILATDKENYQKTDDIRLAFNVRFPELSGMQIKRQKFESRTPKPITEIAEPKKEQAPTDQIEEKVEIPLIITKDMRQQLYDLGLSREAVDKLRPEEAWEVINGKVTEKIEVAESPDFSQAPNFQALYDLIDKVGKVQGSQREYTAEELKGIIDDVRKGLRPEIDITRKFGLRDRVRDLVYQNPERPMTFDSVTSFEALFNRLDELVSLSGSTIDYSPKDLKEIISKVRAGELEPNSVTRSGGLRSKVVELIVKEREKRQRPEYKKLQELRALINRLNKAFTSPNRQEQTDALAKAAQILNNPIYNTAKVGYAKDKSEMKVNEAIEAAVLEAEQEIYKLEGNEPPKPYEYSNVSAKVAAERKERKKQEEELAEQPAEERTATAETTTESEVAETPTPMDLSLLDQEDPALFDVRKDWYQAVRERGRFFNKKRTRLGIGPQYKEIEETAFVALRDQYESIKSSDLDSKIQLFKKFLEQDKNRTPEQINEALALKYIELLKAEESKVDNLAERNDRTAMEHFKAWWKKHAKARLVLGLGLMGVSLAMTGGAAAGFIGGLAVARGLTSGTGTFMTTESLLDTHTKVLGQKGLIDKIKNIGFKVGKRGRISEEDKKTAREKLQDYSTDELGQELARLRLLSLDKGKKVTEAGRFGAKQSLIVEAVQEIYYQRVKEDYQARLAEQAEETEAREDSLLQFLNQEQDMTDTLIQQQEGNRFKNYIRTNIAVLMGVSAGFFVSGRLLEKLTPEADAEVVKAYSFKMPERVEVEAAEPMPQDSLDQLDAQPEPLPADSTIEVDDSLAKPSLSPEEPVEIKGSEEILDETKESFAAKPAGLQERELNSDWSLDELAKEEQVVALENFLVGKGEYSTSLFEQAVHHTADLNKLTAHVFETGNDKLIRNFLADYMQNKGFPGDKSKVLFQVLAGEDGRIGENLGGSLEGVDQITQTEQIDSAIEKFNILSHSPSLPQEAWEPRELKNPITGEQFYGLTRKVSHKLLTGDTYVIEHGDQEITVKAQELKHWLDLSSQPTAAEVIPDSEAVELPVTKTGVDRIGTDSIKTPESVKPKFDLPKVDESKLDMPIEKEPPITESTEATVEAVKSGVKEININGMRHQLQFFDNGDFRLSTSGTMFGNNHEEILKKDWTSIIHNNPDIKPGALSSAETAVRYSARDIYLKQQLLDSPELTDKEKGIIQSSIKQSIDLLEKRYGDVFK